MRHHFKPVCPGSNTGIIVLSVCKYRIVPTYPLPSGSQTLCFLAVMFTLIHAVFPCIQGLLSSRFFWHGLALKAGCREISSGNGRTAVLISELAQRDVAEMLAWQLLWLAWKQHSMLLTQWNWLSGSLQRINSSTSSAPWGHKSRAKKAEKALKT